MHALIIFCAALIVASSATAGAWLRDEKTGFVAYSGVYNEDRKLDGSLYAEYGLRPKFTLGVKVDADMSTGQVGNGTAFVFGRKPINTGARKYRLAYEVGLGLTFGEETDPVLRTGLSYGRGLEMWNTAGWLAVDASVEWGTGDATDVAKLDTTVGLALNDRFKVMMQVFYSASDGSASTTVAPSLIWEPKPKAPSYQLGLESKEGVLAVKLGMWRSF